MLPKIVAGGLIGLLAGYGVLALMHEKGIGPYKPTDVAAEDAAQEDSVKPRNPLVEHRQQRRVAVPPVANAPPVIRPPVVLPNIIPAPPAKIALPNGIPQRAPAPAALNDPPERKFIGRELPAESAAPTVVKLDLDKPLLRVVAETDKASSALCDIEFSHNLLVSPGDKNDYTMVAENLHPHDKRTIELGTHIVHAGAAIEVAIIKRSDAVLCEMKPLFSLPSGKIYPLTLVRGTKLENELAKQLEAANDARTSLPELRTALSNLQSDLRSAQGAMGGNGNTPGETAAGRTQAVQRAASLRGKIVALNRKIAAAERLADQLNEIQADLDAVKQIGSFANSIAGQASISVRFHSGDDAIRAVLK